MGEDLPLDPNQVLPPEEAQTEQQQQQVQHEEVHVPLDQEAVAQESTEEAAERATSRAGQSLTPEEEYYSPNRVQNTEKAEAMAHAQNDYLDQRERATKNLGYSTAYYDKPASRREAVRAGQEFEIDAVAERYGITSEQAREQLRDDTKAFLEYGHAVVENHRKFSDRVEDFGLGLTDTIYEFAKNNPSALKRGAKFVREAEDNKLSQVVTVDIVNDQGTLRFKITDTNEKHHKRTREISTGMFEGAVYKITEYSRDGVGFNVETIRTKELDYPTDQMRYMEDFTDELARLKAYEPPKRAASAQPEDYDEYEEDEDPLAGDVDKWVHPDETRTDEQITHDEKYKVEPY